MTNRKLTKQECRQLIQIAHDNIDNALNDKTYTLPDNLPEIFNEKRGVFVTLNKNTQLRGCIGYIEGYEKLAEAVVDVSLSAAFYDPRFNPLTLSEWDDVELEISVLTPPEEIIVEDKQQYPQHITIGTDGLIIENGYHRGVFLPQVPVEHNMDVYEYLEQLCYKTGLTGNSWMDENTKLYKFQAQVFTQEE